MLPLGFLVGIAAAEALALRSLGTNRHIININQGQHDAFKQICYRKNNLDG